jgi:hypothetical protein
MAEPRSKNSSPDRLWRRCVATRFLTHAGAKAEQSQRLARKLVNNRPDSFSNRCTTNEVNQLTDAVFDPCSKQPSYKACAAQVLRG